MNSFRRVDFEPRECGACDNVLPLWSVVALDRAGILHPAMCLCCCTGGGLLGAILSVQPKPSWERPLPAHLTKRADKASRRMGPIEPIELPRELRARGRHRGYAAKPAGR